jgi:hypothetical protein
MSFSFIHIAPKLHSKSYSIAGESSLSGFTRRSGDNASEPIAQQDRETLRPSLADPQPPSRSRRSRNRNRPGFSSAGKYQNKPPKRIRAVPWRFPRRRKLSGGVPSRRRGSRSTLSLFSPTGGRRYTQWQNAGRPTTPLRRHLAGRAQRRLVDRRVPVGWSDEALSVAPEVSFARSF